MMTRAERKMKLYTSSIERKLNMPSDVRRRVMSDLKSTIAERREAGQTDEEIYAELGSPADVAAELNTQMQAYTYTKSPWRWLCFALILCCCVSLILGGYTGFIIYLFNRTVSPDFGVIGGVDGPTAVFVTGSLDEYLLQMGITVILLVMGVLGFYQLSHCKKNDPGA